MRIATLATVALIVFAGAGCKNLTPERARAICPQVEKIMERVTTRFINSSEGDTARKALESAAVTLTVATQDSTLEFSDLAEIVTSLPFGVLKTDDAMLAVDAGITTLILIFPDGPLVDLSQVESAQIIAGCMATGIRNGLQEN